MELTSSIATIIATAVVIVGLAGLIINKFFDQWMTEKKEDSDTLADVEKTVAVMSHRLEKVEKDMNAVGRVVREVRAELAAVHKELRP